MCLESILRRLHAFFLLEPDKAELLFNIVDHDRIALNIAAIIILTLCRRIGTLELEGLLALQVFETVRLEKYSVDFTDFISIREQFIPGDDVLINNVMSMLVFFKGGVFQVWGGV
jgi:hypothetical protein